MNTDTSLDCEHSKQEAEYQRTDPPRWNIILITIRITQPKQFINLLTFLSLSETFNSSGEDGTQFFQVSTQ